MLWLQIEGMVVNALTERQIATLTNSKRVRLRLKRKVPLNRTAGQFPGLIPTGQFIDSLVLFLQGSSLIPWSYSYRSVH